MTTQSTSRSPTERAQISQTIERRAPQYAGDQNAAIGLPERAYRKSPRASGSPANGTASLEVRAAALCSSASLVVVFIQYPSPYEPGNPSRVDRSRARTVRRNLYGGVDEFPGIHRRRS